MSEVLNSNQFLVDNLEEEPTEEQREATYKKVREFFSRTEFASDDHELPNEKITFTETQRGADFIRDLKEKYPDFDQYFLFHALVGSSFGNQAIPEKFDFEGDFSIQKLMETLAEAEVRRFFNYEKKYSEDGIDVPFANTSKGIEFINALVKRYGADKDSAGSVARYALYHALVASTTPSDQIDRFDFEPPFSIWALMEFLKSNELEDLEIPQISEK